MEPRQVVEKFDRAVDTGDSAALESVCHPDMLTHSFGPTMPQGIEGVRRFVETRRGTGGVGTWDHVVTVAEGEYVIQYGTRSFDWPGGRFRGFDVPAGRFMRDCAFMFRVRDGLITDRWAIRDDLAMMVQLGAVSPARPEEVMHGTVTSYRQDPF
jgi:ketosteroid isomerase-like protein